MQVLKVYVPFSIFLKNENSINKNKIKHNLDKLPYWYIRICAKQIVLRDISIFRFLNSILHLKEVFSLIKESNIFVKFLVTIESLVNIVWFSLIRLFIKKGVGKNRYVDEY